MHLVFFMWMLDVLGNILKNTSCFVARLTVLKESNELERVCGHRLVCIRKLEMMHLGLHKEDLFTLLLRCGYLHGLTKVATLEIADELYSMPHKLVHWHECRLIGSKKPADQWLPTLGNLATVSR
jgi:hypothetical protein